MSMDPNQPPGGSGYPPPPGGPGYPPPPGGPGYPPYGAPPAGAYGAPAAAPAGINGLFEKWKRVTTRPGVASLAGELPTANWTDVWISIIGLGVLTAITGVIGALEFRGAASSIAPFLGAFPRAQQDLLNQALAVSPVSALRNIVTVPLSFFIASAIILVVARLFGGTSTFLQQAYAFVIAVLPVQAAASIIGLVPIVGGFIGFVLSIYGIVLAVLAIAASHRLTIGKSVAVLLIPLAVIFVLACAFAFILAAFFAVSTRTTG